MSIMCWQLMDYCKYCNDGIISKMLENYCAVIPRMLRWTGLCAVHVFRVWREGWPPHGGNWSVPCKGMMSGAAALLGEERAGDRPRGREGWSPFQGRTETNGEHPLCLTTRPLPLPSSLHPTPPSSSSPDKCEKCPSLTISALQRGTTTNSASLTSHGKHSCLSAFARSPFIPATSSWTSNGF